MSTTYVSMNQVLFPLSARHQNRPVRRTHDFPIPVICCKDGFIHCMRELTQRRFATVLTLTLEQRNELLSLLSGSCLPCRNLSFSFSEVVGKVRRHTFCRGKPATGDLRQFVK